MAANLKRVQEIDKLLKVPQYNRKINFGRKDASIEFGDRNSSLIISGSSSGVVVSGSGLFVDSNTVAAGTAASNSSFLALDSNNKIIKTSTSAGISFGDDEKLFFGTDNDAFIEYNEDGDDFLVISGSANGIVLSGSSLVVNTTNGIGVGVSGDDITHAITLPNNNNSTGQIKANAFLSYSSQRYKKEIKVLDNPMDVLSKINGVSFRWRDTDRLDYGFIAEDVGKVLPNIVAWENNEKDAQGMDYLKIISFLVEATKKQQKEIDELKRELSIKH